MILLLVIGEKSAYKKESREREREKEKRTEKQQSLCFHHLLKKIHLFSLQKLCVLLGEARTHKSKSLPISTAHQSSIHRPL